jgi:hypothetical protein
MKHWNLGNTTVRNPNRIKDGLHVFKKYFEGKEWSEKQHGDFCETLIKEGIIKTDDKSLSRRSKEIHGRKWAACFNQLGFAKAWKSKGKIELTDAGNALLSDIEEDVFLRQFLKYHLPSDIETGKLYENFDVNPLYVILKLLNELQQEGIRGITKDEIALYVITCVRNSDIPQAKRDILSHRKQYAEIKGSVGKRKYFHARKKLLIDRLYSAEIKEKKRLILKLSKDYKKNHNVLTSGNKIITEIVSFGKGGNTKNSQKFREVLINGIKTNKLSHVFEFLSMLFTYTKGNTLSDYADTTVRYTMKTGLLSISGNKLILKEDKILQIKSLLENYPQYNEKEYLQQFYSSVYPELPTDDEDFLKKNIPMLQRNVKVLKERLKIEYEKPEAITASVKIGGLKKIQNDLEKDIITLKEEIFYREQARKESIKDIFAYFDKIMMRGGLLGGELYRPAYLEWTVWRLFLAIDNIKNKISNTRNFSIDEELNPIHHAKSGEPDMVFEYNDFVIVCEVTLTTTARQFVEEEPVTRHVAKEMGKTDKQVFGIFIAPSIDNNTIGAFFGQQRSVNGKYKTLDLVPMTIDQIKKVLVKFDKERFSTNDLKLFLEEIAAFQKKSSDPSEWFQNVNKKIESWSVV